LGNAWGTATFHTLPYIEQHNLYRSSRVGNVYSVETKGVYDQTIQVWLCPSDPSVNGNGTVSDEKGTAWGVWSYAANVWLFCTNNENGYVAPEGVPRTLNAAVRDGTSNTLMFGERYAVCTNADNPIGGNSWSYDRLDDFAPPLWGGLGPITDAKSMFLTRPSPGNCDPGLGSTAHSSGMMVCMCDGSVRSVSPSIGPTIWWYINTPAGGEVVPDW
jgi:prepilin-type processing-associated H-X9-DG protein